MKPMIARDVIEELRKLFPEIPECVARIELVVDCADSTTPRMKIDFRPQNAVDAECKEFKITAKSNLSLSNRADGVDGHYCIKRMGADGITAQFYNANIDEFQAFGTVYYSREAAEKKLAELCEHSAT